MNLIVAIDNKNGIGKQNGLLTSIPEDMEFFKKITTNKVVVMGRKTLESLPEGKPLKNRTNIVLSSKPIEGVITCNCVESLLQVLSTYNSSDIFIIGGASIYSQLIKYCDIAYITKINKNFQADTFFPKLNSEWKELKRSETKEYNTHKSLKKD